MQYSGSQLCVHVSALPVVCRLCVNMMPPVSCSVILIPKKRFFDVLFGWWGMCHDVWPHVRYPMRHRPPHAEIQAVQATQQKVI